MIDPLSPAAFSEREQEVLELASDGLTDKEIAAQLSIATKTVRTYWERMRQKTGATSRTQVIAKAFRETYAALRTREQNYRKLLLACEEGVWTLAEACSDVVARFDRELRCLAVNRIFCDAVGVDSSEVAGKKLKDLATYFDSALWEKGIWHVQTHHEPISLETPHPCGGRALTAFIPESDGETASSRVLSVSRRIN